MSIQASGRILLSDLAAEFGDTRPHRMSEFYRDGGKVPGVNSNVPTSGRIRLGNFYGAVNELLQQVTAQASINAQTIFGTDWGAAVPKRLLVPAGVTIGPLTIPTGLGGTLTVQNDGEIQGLGGSGNSGAGGHAITASSSFTLVNTGAVRGGGGGGGLGGTGGQGSATTTQGPSYQQGFTNVLNGSNGYNEFRWFGTDFFNTGATTHTAGGWTYSRGAYQTNITEGGVNYSFYAISRSQTVFTSGGLGGAGGRGRGYGQSLLAGSAGAAGGTNAGVGGTGGTGGDWGLSGATGGTGANGNYTGGLAGSGGGAAGRAVLMLAGNLTLNNSGTLNGAY